MGRGGVRSGGAVHTVCGEQPAVKDETLDRCLSVKTDKGVDAEFGEHYSNSPTRIFADLTCTH